MIDRDIFEVNFDVDIRWIVRIIVEECFFFVGRCGVFFELRVGWFLGLEFLFVDDFLKYMGVVDFLCWIVDYFFWYIRCWRGGWSLGVSKFILWYFYEFEGVLWRFFGFIRVKELVYFRMGIWFWRRWVVYISCK